jgi:hypothetical protein
MTRALNSKKFDSLCGRLKIETQKATTSSKLAAAVIQGSKILSLGTSTNQKNHVHFGHKRMKCSLLTVHAEVAALQDLKHKCHDPRSIDLVVVRYDNEGNARVSKPCVFCVFYFKELPIRRVYYYNEEGVLVYENKRDLVSTHMSCGSRHCAEKLQYRRYLKL